MSESEPKKELLFLCQTLPFPPDGGVNIRSYHLIRLLAKEYRVTAICFYRRAARPSEASVAAGLAGLGALAQVEAFPIPQEYNRVRWAWDHLRSLITGRPYTYFVYESVEVERRLDEILASREFDLVHIDSLDLVNYVPRVRHLPLVCDHHNVESALLHRRARVENSWIRRLYMTLQAYLTRREEARSVGGFDLNLTCSSADAETLAGLAPAVRVKPIPNGVDTQSFQPAGVSPDTGIVFVGGYTWFPNRDGMDWFLAEILPRVRARIPGVATTWVGRMPEDVGRRFSEAGVTVTGYVDDIRPHVARAACFIVPLRVGGGTRLKVLDAWAMGKAVVSTAVGSEGLDVVDGENALLRDDPQGFADAIVEVIRDAALRARLERGARDTAVRTYDWELIGDELLADYRGILGQTALSSRPS